MSDDYSSSGCDTTCCHCGRPVLNDIVWGQSGPYHPEYMRGPGYITVPSQLLSTDNTEIIQRIEHLERHVGKLLAERNRRTLGKWEDDK